MRKLEPMIFATVLLACACGGGGSRSYDEDAGLDAGAGDGDTDSDSDTDADSDADDGGTGDGGGDDCVDSPLIGDWEGTFDGTATSDLWDGTVAATGTMGFEIVCEDKLYLNGEMMGSAEAGDDAGVPFAADMTGVYDVDENVLTVELDGVVAIIFPFTGSLTGGVSVWDPIEMEGTWEGESPDVNGLGDGTWSATMP